MKDPITLLTWRTDLESEEVDSIGQDFLLIDKLILTSVIDQPFKMDMTVAIICLKGTMEGYVNLKKYSIKSPSLFILLSDQILQHEYISEDFSGLFIIMSQRFLNNMFMDMDARFPLFRSVQDNPSIPLEKESLKALVTYYSMLQRAVRSKDHPHRLEIVKHLTLALFYGLGYQYHQLPRDEKKSKQDRLVDDFLKLVKIDFKEHRSVEFYANKLCLTPKYLSKVIKETSGNSAIDWINDYVILEAKALLRSTNMTIQQISDELNFPSQSFFGKYFKRIVGLSPKEYRNK